MKMLSGIKKFNLFLFALLVVAATSCKVDKTATFKDEKAKDISGVWKIKAATRNGIDLKALAPAETGEFRVTFNSDNTFKLTNAIPFLSLTDGTYQFDDPVTPFKITMTGEGREPASTVFSYPISEGKRNISFSFSPGCSGNRYVYVLERAD